MKRSLFIALLSLLLAGLSHGADFYIAPTGDDTTGDGTIGSPWATLAKIDSEIDATNIGCGDTVYARGGTYTTTEDGARITRSCTNGNKLTIKAFTDETPIFQTSGIDFFGTRSVFEISGNFITVDGLQIKPAVSNSAATIGVYNLGSDNIYRNLWIESETRVTGLYTFTACMRIHGNRNEIDSNTIMKCGDPTDSFGNSGYAIQIYGNNNYIHDNYMERGVHDNLSSYSGASDNRYINNTVRNGMGYGIYIQENGDRNLVEGNDFQGSGLDLGSTTKSFFYILGNRNVIRFNKGWSAKNIGVGVAFYDGDNNRFYNNTSYDTKRSGTKMVGNTSPVNSIFLNNVFAKGSQNGFGVFWSGEIADVSTTPNTYFALANNNQFRYNYIVSYVSGVWQNDYINVYDQIDAARYTVSNMENPTVSGYYGGSTPLWSNNIYNYCDPKFTDPDNGDFSIAADSCLIDAGGTMTATNGTGSNSVTLIVDDSFWFWPGDEIKINGATARTIDSIDYGTHTLTLTASASWGDGETVTIDYEGAAPDIGSAVESAEVVSEAVSTGVSISSGAGVQ